MHKELTVTVHNFHQFEKIEWKKLVANWLYCRRVWCVDDCIIVFFGLAGKGKTSY